MTTATGLASDVRAALGTDLSKELQRLEPLKGKLGSRIIQTVQNEVNRLVNIFKTGKFSTDAQVCVLLDKEVRKISKLMSEETKLMKKKGTDESLIKQDIKFRESVEAISGKMAEILHKFAGKNNKPSKELLKLNEDLKKLYKENHKEIEHDKKTLQNFDKLRAREEVAPRRRVQFPENVAELGTTKYFFGKDEAIRFGRDLQQTLQAVLQKTGGKNLSEKDQRVLKSVADEKFAGMEPEKLRQKLITLVPLLQKGMYQERFSNDIESAFERIRTAVKEMPSRAQAEAKPAAPYSRTEEKDFPETSADDAVEGRERAAAMMRGIKETSKVPGSQVITSKVDVDRARSAVIKNLPRLVQTLERNGIKISEHPDESERKLLEETTEKILKGKTSEELATILEDTLAAIHHGYTIAETGPGHVPEDVKRNIEGLKDARRALGAFAKGEVAGREKLAKNIRAKGQEAAREISERRESKIQFGQRISEFEPVFGGREERRAKFEEGKKAKREETSAARRQANVDFEKELAARGKTVRRDKSVQEVISTHAQKQEQNRLIEIAKREKTLAQTSLAHTISQAYEIGGSPFTNFLGIRSEKNKRLEALRDQEPGSFKTDSAKEAIRIIKEGFDDDLPEDIVEEIKILEERIKSVDKLSTTRPAKWK